MEVILREHVDNLGRRGDVVKVADGYARNFLLPRKLALPVTEENRKQIERERKVADVREARGEAGGRGGGRPDGGARAGRSQRRVGENDTLYGSVTSADVADALEAKGFDVDKRKVALHEPLKQLGEFEVPVKIHREVTAHVKVRVVPLGRRGGGAAAPAAPAPNLRRRQ